MRTVVNAIMGLPEGEERFSEAGARLEPYTLSMQRNFLLASPRVPAISRHVDRESC